MVRLTVLEQRSGEPAKASGDASGPPSEGQKLNRSDTAKPAGPHEGSLGRKGGGRSWMAEPDQIVSATATGCRHGAGRGAPSPPQPIRQDRTAARQPRGDAPGGAAARRPLGAPTQDPDGQRSPAIPPALRPRRRYGARPHPKGISSASARSGATFTVLIHPDVPPDNEGSERELRPTATCRKGHGRFPLPRERRPFRRHQIRRRHGRTLRRRRLRGRPQHAMRVSKSRTGLSRFHVSMGSCI